MIFLIFSVLGAGYGVATSNVALIFFGFFGVLLALGQLDLSHSDEIDRAFDGVSAHRLGYDERPAA